MAQERLKQGARRVSARSRPASCSAAILESAIPSIHSRVSTSRVVRSQSTRRDPEVGIARDIFAEFAGGCGLEPEIHLHAHVRASVATTSTSSSRRASAKWRSAIRAAKYMSDRSRRKRRSIARSQHLDGDGVFAVGVAHPGVMHLGDRSRRHRFAEFAENRLDRFAEGGLRPWRSHRRARTAPCGLEHCEIAHHRRTDDVGPRARNWPSFT